MISLEDLKSIIKPKNKESSNLEYHIMYWLDNQEVVSYDLSEDEVFYGLSHYLDGDTLGFWRKYLGSNTVKIYTKLGESCVLVDLILKEALNDLTDLRATLKITENSQRIVFENSYAAQLIKYVNPSFNLDERFANVLDFSKENLDYPVNVAVHQNFMVSSLGGSILEEVEEYMLTSLEIIKNSIAISLVVMSLGSLSAMASDNSAELKDALESSTKAFARTDTGKEMINNVKVNGQRSIKNFQKENPMAEIPVAILGYGLKVAQDKGINLKTKNSKVFDDTTYEILVGKELEVSMSGKNPIADKSSYKIQARPDQVKMNVAFDIDW